MDEIKNLTPDFIVGDLPLHDFQVNLDTLGEVVAAQFEQHPDLPGVIVADRERVVGVISRQTFQNLMLRRFGLEILLKRPLSIIFSLGEPDDHFTCLQVPYNEPIDSAVQKVLQRSLDAIYEPVLVIFKDESVPGVEAYFLLDVRTLLLAQSQILKVANQAIQQQKQEAQSYLENLQQEQEKAKNYAHLLERHQVLIEQHNHQLEVQKAELVRRNQEIEDLNQRFIQMGQILSREGKKAFQATFAGVNAICRNTNQIVAIGEFLAEEMGTIQEASQLVARVSQQVQHLSVQASIVANHSGQELRGFSFITNEISKLVTQTLEASRQTERVANHFKNRIQELMEAAQLGTSTARSLVKKIEQAEIALAEMENLVTHQNQPFSFEEAAGFGDLVELAAQPEATLASQTQARSILSRQGTHHDILMQRITQAEATLTELKELIVQQQPRPLLRKIQRVLDRQQESMAQ